MTDGNHAIFEIRNVGNGQAIDMYNFLAPPLEAIDVDVCHFSAGVYEVYQIRKDLNPISAAKYSWGEFAFPKISSGGVYSEITSSAYQFSGVNISFSELYSPDFELGSEDSSAISRTLTAATRSLCQCDQFRPSRGNQIVGNAFTLCSTSSSPENSGSIPDQYLAEIAVKEGASRTRVRFLYRTVTAQAETTALKEKEIAEGAFDLALVGFVVLWERSVGERETLTLPTYDHTRGGQLGRGIYDPQEEGDAYGESLRRPSTSLLILMVFVLTLTLPSCLALLQWSSTFRAF
jgi:hypothetical protein